MEISISFKNIKKFFTWRNLKESFWIFLENRSTLVFFAVIIILFIFCIYVWYGSIYASGWDEAKRQAYITEKGKKTSFNQTGFEEIKSNFSERMDKLNQDNIEVTDIFQLNR